MLLYFILGSIAGIILLGFSIVPKLLKYRQEVKLMKQSVEQLESLNAVLQFQSYQNISNQKHVPQARVISMA